MKYNYALMHMEIIIIIIIIIMLGSKNGRYKGFCLYF